MVVIKAIVYTILLLIFIFYINKFVYKLYTILILKRKYKKRNSVYKKLGIIKRIYFQLPKRIVDDQYEKDIDFFEETGCRLIVGEQGAGKTITMCYLLQKYKAIYPKMKIATNMNYLYQDREIVSIDDIIFHNNDIYGEIDAIDEMQNWFNSNQSKDFPVTMLQEISQQRKQRKMILGTSQVWQRVSKPLREQITLIYKPMTFFGAITLVFEMKPFVKSDGQIEELKFRRMYFFVHTKELRDSFDTYKTIQMLQLQGWKPATEQIGNENAAQIISIVPSVSKLKSKH